jgi:hypothetical protein
MSIITLIIVLVVVGLALYLINMLPIDPKIRQIIYILAIILVILWLLSAVGFLGDFHIGRLR